MFYFPLLYFIERTAWFLIYIFFLFFRIQCNQVIYQSHTVKKKYLTHHIKFLN